MFIIYYASPVLIKQQNWSSYCLYFNALTKELAIQLNFLQVILSEFLFITKLESFINSSAMPKKEQTKLEVLNFSDKAEDKFHCLMDLTNKSSGIDLEKLSSAEPGKLDEVLEKMGCLAIFSPKDVGAITNGLDCDPDELHDKLYHWAQEQGIV